MTVIAHRASVHGASTHVLEFVAPEVETAATDTAATDTAATDTAATGTPVLMLHGNPDSGDLWIDVATRLVSATSASSTEGLRFLAPDLPGFGCSEESTRHRATLAAEPLRAMHDWVDGLLDALEIDGPLHLVGHDFGGVYLGAWAIEHPDRVASLAMLDTFFHADHRWHVWARVWRTPVLGELSMRAFSFPLFRFEMRRGSPRLSEKYLRDVFRHATREARQAALRLYRATDPAIFDGPEERLRRLMRERPSLALWGADDPYLPVLRARAFDADRVVVLDGCGHWPPVERPDAVAQALLPLLTA